MGCVKMKIKVCPQCGNKELGDRWSSNGPHGRMLEQYCEGIDEDEVLPPEHYEEKFHHNWGMMVRVCNWVGEARTPEIQNIRTVRKHGWETDRGSLIEIFDRYGHTMSYGGNYGKDVEAYIAKELARGLTDADAGPYKATYWKGSVRRGVVYDGSTNPPTKMVSAKTRGIKEIRKELEDLCEIWEGRVANNNSEGRTQAGCAERIRAILAGKDE